MAQKGAKQDVISSIRFYVDKIVSDPSLGGSNYNCEYFCDYYIITVSSFIIS